VAGPFPAPVIASEAKQSRGVSVALDCFVAALSAAPAGAHRKRRLDPSFVVTHRGTLEEGPDLYKTFRNRKDGCIKVVLQP